MTKTFDPHKTTNDVRQASGRKMNSRVLFWSLGGVVVAFILVFIAFTVLAPSVPTVPAV